MNVTPGTPASSLAAIMQAAISASDTAPVLWPCVGGLLHPPEGHHPEPPSARDAVAFALAHKIAPIVLAAEPPESAFASWASAAPGLVERLIHDFPGAFQLCLSEADGDPDDAIRIALAASAWAFGVAISAVAQGVTLDLSGAKTGSASDTNIRGAVINIRSRELDQAALILSDVSLPGTRAERSELAAQLIRSSVVAWYDPKDGRYQPQGMAAMAIHERAHATALQSACPAALEVQTPEDSPIARAVSNLEPGAVARLACTLAGPFADHIGAVGAKIMPPANILSRACARSSLDRISAIQLSVGMTPSEIDKACAHAWLAAQLAHAGEVDIPDHDDAGNVEIIDGLAAAFAAQRRLHEGAAAAIAAAPPLPAESEPEHGAPK